MTAENENTATPVDADASEAAEVTTPAVEEPTAQTAEQPELITASDVPEVDEADEEPSAEDADAPEAAGAHDVSDQPTET